MLLKDKLRMARERRAMSQEQLAKKSNITQATISRIENGKIVKLRMDTLVGLSLALGVSPNYFCREQERVSQREDFGADRDVGKLVRRYRRLTAEGKVALTTYLGYLERQDRARRKKTENE